MDLYHYHPATGEYLTTTEARVDHLETEARRKVNPAADPVYLVPANATSEAPPIPGENEAAKFNGQSWVIVPDFRGSIYWPAGAAHDSEPGRITDLGVAMPAGATLTRPEVPTEVLQQRAVSEALAAAKQETRRRLAAVVDPLTGQPASNATDQAAIERDLLIAQSNQAMVLNQASTPQAVRDAIAAAQAQAVATLSAAKVVYSEIDAAADPGAVDIVNNPAWP